MTQELTNDITRIIDEIPNGMLFDAHSVIEQLILRFSDDYLNGYSHGETTKSYHSRISKEIKRLLGDYLPYECYSFNIHNNLSPNKCWIKRQNITL